MMLTLTLFYFLNSDFGRADVFFDNWKNKEGVKDSPNEVLAMTAEGWMLEEPWDELVVFHLQIFPCKTNFFSIIVGKYQLKNCSA